jgi:hypothetical protein
VRRALWARFLGRDTLGAQDWPSKATGVGKNCRNIANADNRASAPPSAIPAVSS